MRSNDLANPSVESARQALTAALAGSDTEAAGRAYEQLAFAIADSVRQDFEDFRSEGDRQILMSRGVRQLTSEEQTFYQRLLDAMRSNNPRQAIANMDVVMPQTVIDNVFEGLTQAHPLLDAINFNPTGGAVKMMVNTHTTQAAAWGALDATIVQELTSGFKEIDVGLLKLSAFVPVCNAMLDLGPAWLDAYVRRILGEAIAYGMEIGIVSGDGNGSPIGMTRQVGPGVTVTGGVYPEKAAVSVSDFAPATVGNLISLLATDEAGKPRNVTGLILVANPIDYFQRVMPATTVMAPDGTYRNDVLPYPMQVIQSVGLPQGKAVLGIGTRYFAAAGISKDGRVEYSDEYHFLEDERVYKIKTYANGFPLDNNAFLVLDISGLKSLAYHVISESAPAASTTATLSALSLGKAALSPAFASGTDTYTATTTDATNAIKAVPTDAAAKVSITLNGAAADNGSALKWAEGSNTVVVTVTAESGATGTYTVTVTKS